MSDETSIVQYPRDYSDITHLGEPEVLEEFLSEPLTFIAETITGFLCEGKKGLFVSGGKLAQAVFKGRVYRQFAEEVKTAREKGRIAEDFADKKYGFTTWVELMTILDDEVPDEDRLEALKALFFAVNNPSLTDKERVAEYQAWQVTKQLQSGELYLMSSIYKNQAELSKAMNTATWISGVAGITGFGSTGLIDLHESRLVEQHILTPRHHGDGSGIRPANGRLTDLGIRICKNIETYRTTGSR